MSCNKSHKATHMHIELILQNVNETKLIKTHKNTHTKIKMLSFIYNFLNEILFVTKHHAYMSSLVYVACII